MCFQSGDNDTFANGVHIHSSVWAQISGWISLPCLHPRHWKDDNVLATWYGDLSGVLPAGSAKGAKSLIVLACWTVWCKRNRRIFNGVERTVGQVVAIIQSEARQWIHRVVSQCF
jgi:hypothetical protein